jgi:hypothetical protein
VSGCDGICKLGDFGLIVDLTNPSQMGWREGDSKYLAPEVLRGVITKVCTHDPQKDGLEGGGLPSTWHLKYSEGLSQRYRYAPIIHSQMGWREGGSKYLARAVLRSCDDDPKNLFRIRIRIHNFFLSEFVSQTYILIQKKSSRANQVGRRETLKS